MIDYCAAEEHPGEGVGRQAVQLSDENCLHISYEAGKLEDPAVNGVEIVDFGMTVSPQQAPDKVEQVTIGFERGVPVTLNGEKKSPLAMVETTEQDRRPQRRRPDRHGREPLRRHEEPRRVRSPRHDDALRGPSARSSSSRSTATWCTSATGSRPKSPRWCTTASGTPPRWTP